MLQTCHVVPALLCLALLPAAASADAVQDQLDAIADVGLQGQGSAAARAAREQLARSGPQVLPRLLKAMNTANVVAANWYRTVYDDIVDRQLAAQRHNLPVEHLQDFVRNPQNAGRVRRLVLATLDRVAPDFGPQLLPRLLDDPEFRGEAVDLALAAGEAAKVEGRDDEARAAFQRAFRHARDSAHVLRAARGLRGVGAEVSIVRHMGFVVDWYLLGPFDAPAFSGFEKAFPPEQDPGRVDLQATYEGQGGRPIAWKRHRTTDALGQVNLIRAIGPAKEAVAYAYAELDSPAEQHVELRCGADDNCTVWLNGEKIFARGQWLNGTRLDRFTAPAALRKGTNRLLVKVCQGPQHKNPAVPNNWSLQLRFCTADGAGAGHTSALPADGTSSE